MYATQYGEQRVVELPDHSVVSLNANSTLRFRNDWSQANTLREVWLDGEAFFSVQKQEGAAGPAKFIVHTNDLDVEVLGTRFNVSNRMAGGRESAAEPQKPGYGCRATAGVVDGTGPVGRIFISQASSDQENREPSGVCLLER